MEQAALKKEDEEHDVPFGESTFFAALEQLEKERKIQLLRYIVLGMYPSTTYRKSAMRFKKAPLFVNNGAFLKRIANLFVHLQLEGL